MLGQCRDRYTVFRTRRPGRSLSRTTPTEHPNQLRGHLAEAVLFEVPPVLFPFLRVYPVETNLLTLHRTGLAPVSCRAPTLRGARSSQTP